MTNKAEDGSLDAHRVMSNPSVDHFPLVEQTIDFSDGVSSSNAHFTSSWAPTSKVRLVSAPITTALAIDGTSAALHVIGRVVPSGTVLLSVVRSSSAVVGVGEFSTVVLSYG